MNKKINLKKLIDLNYFELPKSWAKSHYFAVRHSMNLMQYSCELPEIFVCNKSCDYDKYFVSGSMSCNHVFLKDEIIKKFHNGSIDNNEIKSLKEKINELFKNDISLIIFPEKHRTIFGDYEIIPLCITNFIKSLEKKVRFISLINTYFIKPIWSAQQNKCEIKIEQRFNLSSASSRNMSETEYNEKFNGFMPSSASTYILKYPLFLKSKKPAENLESIIYACPNCKNLFSLYSEFSCVKCAECGTAFELSNSGELSLTRHFDSFDSAKEFQKHILFNYNFENKLIVSYKDIILFNDEKLNKKTSMLSELKIYADHLKFSSENQNKKIDYNEIFDLELLPDNILIIDTKIDKIIIQGTKRENFYIIFDLIEKLGFK